MKATITPIVAKLPLAKERMEVVVQDLVEQGHLAPESITIHPEGLFARGYNGDILGVSWSEKEGRVALHVCREGLYDMLPKALFHPPKATPTSRILEDRLVTVQQTVEEEGNAREFFLPFEQEFFRHRITIEQEERQLLGGFSNPIQQALFTQLFGKLDFITAYQQEILFYLLPFIAHIVGDFDLTARSFASLLGDPVRITPLARMAHVFQSEQHSGLSEAQLGMDWIIGDVTFECFPQLNIVVGPVALENLDKYLPEGNHSKLIAYLVGYLLPMEMEYTVEVIEEQQASLFTLNEVPQAARLGYSTVFNGQ